MVRPWLADSTWWPTLCLPLHWSSAWRLFPTTICRTSKPANSSALPCVAAGCTDHRRCRSVVMAPILQLDGMIRSRGRWATANALAALQAAPGVRAGQGSIWWLAELVAGFGEIFDRCDKVASTRHWPRRTTNPAAATSRGGSGMYLSAALSWMIPIGAFLGRIYDSWARWSGDDDERKKRLRHARDGLIVGEKPIWGASFCRHRRDNWQRDEPLAMVGDGFRFASCTAGSHRLAGLAWLYQQSRHSVVPAGSAGPAPSHARFAWYRIAPEVRAFTATSRLTSTLARTLRGSLRTKPAARHMQPSWLAEAAQ